MILAGHIIVLVLAIPMALAPVHAASFRGYATVIDVEPIETTFPVPVTRQVCHEPGELMHLSQPFAATIADDIRRQITEWRQLSSCSTVTDTETLTKITGYRVTYRYREQIRTTRLSYHPGGRLAVNVDVAPLP